VTVERATLLAASGLAVPVARAAALDHSRDKWRSGPRENALDSSPGPNWRMAGNNSNRNMDTLAPDLQRIAAALDYAARCHRNQRRKNEEQDPYINHPIGLLHVLAVEAHITDADVLCAALLHDVIEDCACNPEERLELAAEIERRFGARVLQIVEEVTDDKTISKADRKRAQVEHAKHLTHAAKLVKLADKTVNLRDVVHSPPVGWPLRRRREYFDWANEVVQAIGPAHAKLRTLFDEAFAARP